MRYGWIWMVVLLVAGVSGTALGAAKDSDVTAKVFADVAAVRAGESFSVAVELEMRPGWHVYWTNPGDAGERTKLTYRVPAGYSVAPAAFPLPRKFLQAGDITAYGYEGKVVFLATVTAPKVLPAGDAVQIGVHAAWLCCKDVCVPGAADLSLTLPVAKDAGAVKGGKRDENRALFAEARGAIPAAAPADLADVEATTGGVSIAWKKMPQGEVEVFPLSLNGVEVSGMKAQTQGDKTLITLHARLLAGHTLKTDDLPLLVVYHDAKGVRRGFFTDWNLRPLAAGGK